MPAPTPVPSPELVRDAGLVSSLFGRFDLHDADVRAVRVALGEGNVPTLELDVDLPGASALPGAAADRAADYRVTLRCVDVSQLSLADFGGQNVVSEYAFARDGQDDEGRHTVRVAVTCAPGCDLELRCREVGVKGVERLRRHA